jgi:hypothetical protein
MHGDLLEEFQIVSFSWRNARREFFFFYKEGITLYPLRERERAKEVLCLDSEFRSC